MSSINSISNRKKNMCEEMSYNLKTVNKPCLWYIEKLAFLYFQTWTASQRRKKRCAFDLGCKKLRKNVNLGNLCRLFFCIFLFLNFLIPFFLILKGLCSIQNHGCQMARIQDFPRGEGKIIYIRFFCPPPGASPVNHLEEES